MPELPEVETVVRTLRPAVVGHAISAVTLNRTDILTPAGISFPALLVGQQIHAIDRRAKRIVFTLSNHNRFYIHLGMSGQLTFEPADAPLKTHTHLILTLQPKDAPAILQIRFRDPRRFGGVFWLGQNSHEQNLGPEPLNLRVSQLQKRLARTTRPIKSALLDQSVIAGIGNIYADEALFAAHIHPLTPANRISPDAATHLNRAIKSTLRKAIALKGSTLRDFINSDNLPGGYRTRHKVYDREGEKCPRCKTPIVRIVLTARSTCFCPTCQPPRTFE